MRLSAFLLLITAITIHAQTKTFDLTDLRSTDFTEFLSDKKIIVIGEMHGTTEVPSFVLQLIKDLKEKDKNLIVGLEIQSDLQENVDAFLEHGDFSKLLALDYFKYPDGRTSVAMGSLIQGIREMKGTKIVCFDIPSGLDPKINRDSLMGVNLTKGYQGNKMVILTGNLHANLKEGYWRPNFKSATYHFNKINNFGDKLISLNTYFGGGTIWNCMSDGCREREAGKVNIGNTNGMKTFVGIYETENSSGYSGYIYFDSVTASKPMVQ